MRGAAASLLLWAGAAAAQGLPPLLDDAGALHTGWRVTTLPDQKPPVTRFSAGARGRARRRAASRRGRRTATWCMSRSRPRRRRARCLVVAVQQPNPGRPAHQARRRHRRPLCLSFDLPLDRVPFVERQLLRWRARAAASTCRRPRCAGPGAPRAVGSRDRQPLQPARALPGAARAQADGRGTLVRRTARRGGRLPPCLRRRGRRAAAAAAVIVAADADNTGAYSVAQVAGLQFEP
jgi:hypothetical protein